MAMDAKWLQGKQVALTGRLASMTRRELTELIRTFGAEFVPALTRHTSVLVIGQEGWPVGKDGYLSPKLRKAHHLQGSGHAIVILSEEELLAQVGLDLSPNEVHRFYTTAQLCRLLHVSRDRIRSWIRAGIIKPVQIVHGVSYFDFRQVTGVRTLAELSRSGLTPKQIRHSLEQLQTWLPDLEQPLAQLAMIERDGRLLVRLDEGRLAEPSGQGVLDFADEPECVVVQATPARQTAQEWFDMGHKEETAGHLTEAAAAYRQRLLLGGPDAQVCFNLANVLYALGQYEGAAERFRQSVEINHGFAEAWNNLGTVLTELDQHDEAIAAYRKAIELNSDYALAHYNLADTLYDLSRQQESRHHWQAYLRLQSEGESADYARGCLAKIELMRLG
jgi:DNA-binding transcriptional MerR regulator